MNESGKNEMEKKISTAINQNITYNIQNAGWRRVSVSLLTCAHFMRRGFIIMSKYICTNYTNSHCCSYDSHSNQRTPPQLRHIKLIKLCRWHKVFIRIHSVHVFLSSIWHLFVKLCVYRPKNFYLLIANSITREKYKYVICITYYMLNKLSSTYHIIKSILPKPVRQFICIIMKCLNGRSMTFGKMNIFFIFFLYVLFAIMIV